MEQATWQKFDKKGLFGREFGDKPQWLKARRPSMNDKKNNIPYATSYAEKIKYWIHTSATASLAAIIMISAHETTPGQALSKASLTPSMTWKDLREFTFERASFSPSMVGVSSSSIEASQPFYMERVVSIYKNNLNFVIKLRREILKIHEILCTRNEKNQTRKQRELAR